MTQYNKIHNIKVGMKTIDVFCIIKMNLCFHLAVVLFELSVTVDVDVAQSVTDVSMFF